jgi:pimeloyl-ACP methyl ester carboxylesterase
VQIPSCDQQTGLCSPAPADAGGAGWCGDNVCDALEQAHPALCPLDCNTTSPDAGFPPGEEFRVTNPTSGNAWWCKVFRPAGVTPGTPLPTVFVVPGGSGAASQGLATRQPTVPALTAAGYAVVVFDADGRGLTAGQEDFNGFTHQDGLKAVVETVAARVDVMGAQMGLVTQSYGITMGSGLLSRYPLLPLRFLVDWEGPADRRDTGHCDPSNTGHITHDCSDDAWWAEREAATFARSLQVPYLRIQTVVDHAQPDNDHVLTMVNSATAAAHGGLGVSPWTRVNDASMNAANATYTTGSPPTYLPESTNTDAKVVQYVTELLAM